MKMGDGSLRYKLSGTLPHFCSIARIRGLENLSCFDLGLTPQA
jgi:hypothetical protein